MTMALNKARLYQLHRFLAPIMVIPIFITLITGSLYQLADLSRKEDEFRWLLAWHKGHFGILNLASVYPFLNALGLLTLAITGILMWFQKPRRQQRRTQDTNASD